jgi:hypothetical protein
MSHIGKLFNKAVNPPYLENNKIGKFTIEPQHGANGLYVYHIHKDIETTRIIKQHILRVEIVNRVVRIHLGKVYYTTYKRDYQNLLKEIELLYPNFQIQVIQ